MTLAELLHRITPRIFITYGVIALCCGVYAATVTAGLSPLSPSAEDLLRWGASHGPVTTDGQWWRLVTAGYLHVGALHLGLNMFVLHDLGRVVERLYGNLAFAVLYTLSGIGGSLASLVASPLAVSAGASGAVFGVAGALCAALVRQRRELPAGLVGGVTRSLLPFLVINIAIGAFVPFIDLAGHLGGLVTGFVAGLVLSVPLSRPTGRTVRALAVALCGAGLVAGSIAFLPRVHDSIREPFSAAVAETGAGVSRLAAAQKASPGGKTVDHALLVAERDRAGKVRAAWMNAPVPAPRERPLADATTAYLNAWYVYLDDLAFRAARAEKVDPMLPALAKSRERVEKASRAVFAAAVELGWVKEQDSTAGEAGTTGRP